MGQATFRQQEMAINSAGKHFYANLSSIGWLLVPTDTRIGLSFC